MSLSQQDINLGLGAKGTPDNIGVSGSARIGNINVETGAFEGARKRSYPLATIASAFRVTSAAPANVATLTLSTGDVAATTGSPVILGDGVDFEGDALPTLAKLAGIRIRTRAANVGTVTVAGSTSGVVPAVTLAGDSDILISFAAAGRTASGTVTFTFSAASDQVHVEYLGMA